MSEMINGRLSLLLDDDLEQLAQAADALRTLLPGINVDRFAEAFPIVLDVDNFKMALEVRDSAHETHESLVMVYVYSAICGNCFLCSMLLVCCFSSHQFTPAYEPLSSLGCCSSPK